MRDRGGFCVIAKGHIISSLQELHIVLAHILCEYAEKLMFGEESVAVIMRNQNPFYSDAFEIQETSGFLLAVYSLPCSACGLEKKIRFAKRTFVCVWLKTIASLQRFLLDHLWLKRSW